MGARVNIMKRGGARGDDVIMMYGGSNNDIMKYNVTLRQRQGHPEWWFRGKIPYYQHESAKLHPRDYIGNVIFTTGQAEARSP